MEINVSKPRMITDGVKLLEAVKAHLRQEPLRLRMVNFLRTFDPKVYPPGTTVDEFGVGWGEGNFEVPACGTVGCLAGWMAQLRGRPERASILGVAEILGLPFQVCHDLCMVTSWPEDLAERYFDATSTTNPQETRVELACEAIDRFIAEYGPEVPRATS